MRAAMLVAVAALLAARAAAQPTIDASYLSDFVGQSLQSLTYDILPADFAAVESIMGSTGGHATYDFSTLSHVGPTMRRSQTRTTLAGTPGEGIGALSATNFVWINLDAIGNEQSFVFYVLDASGYRRAGLALVQDVTGDTVPDTTLTVYDPPRTLLEFPVEPGATWSEVNTVTTTAPSGTFEQAETWEVTVEGWGDLVLPGGIATPVYKVRWTTTQGAPGATFTTNVYQFVANGPYSASIVPAFAASGVAGASYTVTSLSTRVELPPTARFDLDPNYPDPTDNSTVIPLELRSAGEVVVTVVDLLGREVRHSNPGTLAPGRHEIVLDVAGLPAGPYLYRVRSSDGRARTGSLMVIR